MTEGYALITGASAGLGAEFARQLASQGWNLILVARREARLVDFARELADSFGVTVRTCVADLVDPEAPAAVEQFCQAENLQVDWLVNNAGVAGPDLLEDRDWSQQRDFFQLMMLSVAELCHRFVPGMADRGFGRVVNVASVAGRIPRSGGCNYGPSKTYLVALSEEQTFSRAIVSEKRKDREGVEKITADREPEFEGAK